MNSLRKVIIKTFVCLAVCVSGGCSVRQEQFKYLSIRKEHETFSLIARLKGTYYQDRCGDVDKPYTLFASITPTIKGDFLLRNIALYSEGESPVFETDYPEVKTEIGVNAKRFFFIRIPGLDIDYKEYRIKFEIWKDGELYQELEFLFEKDFSSRLTHPWLEKINSA